MGVYDLPSGPQLEQLMDLLNEYPHQVSVDLLKKALPNYHSSTSAPRFGSLLDVGCGTNANLSEYVMLRCGAQYYGLDKGTVRHGKQVIPTAEILASKIRRSMFYCPDVAKRIMIGDVLDIPPLLPRVDVVHMRFVLMHIHYSKWAQALCQVKNKLKPGGTALLLEYDWETFQSSDRCKVHIELFVAESLRFCKVLKVFPYTGQKLLSLASEAFPNVAFWEFQRPEAGGRLKEILALCAMQREVAEQIGNQEFTAIFGQLYGLFNEFVAREWDISFTPPKICAVAARLT